MHDDSIVERKIERRHDNTDKDSVEPELDGDNVQLNVKVQSDGKLSITSSCENVTKNCDQEITMDQKFYGTRKK